jgi:hypothetical protein
MDSAATSTVIHPKDNDNVIITNEKSHKIFYNANGTVSAAGMKAQLPFNLRALANEAETVPSLAMNSLLSTSKLADANYITIFTKDKVKVFDAETARVDISGEAVMKGWRCPTTKLWRVPLKGNYQNLNTDTTLLSTKATDIILKKQEGMDPLEFVNSALRSSFGTVFRLYSKLDNCRRNTVLA